MTNTSTIIKYLEARLKVIESTRISHLNKYARCCADDDSRGQDHHLALESQMAAVHRELTSALSIAKYAPVGSGFGRAS